MNTCPVTAVRAGRVRDDLYYRLNVVAVSLPPLRERREDIPRLSVHFLARYSGEMNKRFTGFSADAMAQLVRYSWPGNVRELEHAVDRAVIFARHSVVEPDDLVLPKAFGSEEEESFRTLKARMIAHFERDHITGSWRQTTATSAARHEPPRKTGGRSFN